MNELYFLVTALRNIHEDILRVVNDVMDEHPEVASSCDAAQTRMRLSRACAEAEMALMDFMECAVAIKKQ